ncbi:MAG TPA: Holliday junction branch migration protein RuvA [Bacteroidota bacterium]|jgi:Holliday junction DNA helicase RuvA
MIAQLTGRLVRKSPTELVIDVNGVGYLLNVSLSTFESVAQSEGSVTILTHLHVREDILQLFGFATDAERELFRLLISVSGIGPKMAQGILSGLSPAQLRNAIASGNLAALTSISGVGTKTAERIILELRSKLGRADAAEAGAVPTSGQLRIRSEALVALMSLGYSRPNAEKAIQTVIREANHQEFTVEELIKLALHHAGK